MRKHQHGDTILTLHRELHVESMTKQHVHCPYMTHTCNISGYDVTHSHVVLGNMVETSKAIFSRLYELGKLFNDNSKFSTAFQYVHRFI